MHVRPLTPLRKRRPQLSKRFERVVMKCLAKHPDDRYRDAAALLADLAVLDGTRRRGLLARWRTGGQADGVSRRRIAATDAPRNLAVPFPFPGRFPRHLPAQHRLRRPPQLLHVALGMVAPRA